MAATDGLTFEGVFNNGTTGLYKDNTSNDISEADLRALPTAIRESYLNRIDDAYTGSFPQFTTATSTTAYTGTAAPAITAYATGQKFQVKIHATNTGASTLNLNALGAKKVFTNPTTQATTGNLLVDQVYILVYDAALDTATGGFLMVGSGSGGGGTISDTAFAGSWNGVTTDGASKNALYDEFILKQYLINAATAITDASTMDIAAMKNTLTTSSGTRTFTISYTGDDITLEITLNTTSSVLTFPATALTVSDGAASGNNTCTLEGVSGDKYMIAIKKIGSAYYVVSKNFGQ